MRKGDVVTLKSGGDPITVQEIQQDGRVLCVWNYRGKIVREAFDADLLKTAEHPVTLEDIVRAAGGAPDEADPEDG